MTRETWIGRVDGLAITKENSDSDWVIVRMNHSSSNAPRWYALDLSQRTPTSMAMYNQLRDAQKARTVIRLTVQRNRSRNPSWQESLIIAIEDPAFPSAGYQRFN